MLKKYAGIFPGILRVLGGRSVCQKKKTQLILQILGVDFYLSQILWMGGWLARLGLEPTPGGGRFDIFTAEPRVQLATSAPSSRNVALDRLLKWFVVWGEGDYYSRSNIPWNIGTSLLEYYSRINNKKGGISWKAQASTTRLTLASPCLLISSPLLPACVVSFQVFFRHFLRANFFLFPLH